MLNQQMQVERNMLRWNEGVKSKGWSTENDNPVACEDPESDHLLPLNLYQTSDHLLPLKRKLM